ncbi:ACH10-like protein, partial [Mya arenaria]
MAVSVRDEGYDERWPSDFSAEGVLIKNLLEGYNKRAGKYARPVFNHTHAVPVRLMLQLIQIIDLDEKNQVLKLNLWTNYYWIDEFLRWNPDDYAGVSEIRIPSDLIWTPDIKLYNYADTRKDERRDALCVLSIYMSSCEINVNTFPFDKQTCHLKFGSWTYDGSKLNLSFYGEKEQMITDDYFVPNKAWTVLETPGKRTVEMYTCCPNPYIDITYTVVFRRSATFYTYILIVPCVLLTTLTLVLYWIPPESPTKMALGMSIFMAFFVLLLLFEGNMPPASEDVPILGTYYCLNMILITTSTFLNVFVVNLSFYGSRAAIPKLMKTVMFEYVARILCMDNLVRPFLEADKKRLIPVAIPGLGLVNGGNGKFQKNWKGSTELLSNRKDELQIDPQLAEIDSKLADVKEFIAAYFERLDDKDRREKLAKEWKAVGLIFDRLFFWIYLVTILTSLSV